jgi:NitT/TauT family transport system permease protein
MTIADPSAAAPPSGPAVGAAGRLARSPIGLYRVLVVGGLIGALELACRTGAISPRVMIPPSEMTWHLQALIARGQVTADLVETLGNVAIAFVLAVGGGLVLGAAIHRRPRLRRAIDPFLASYYAIPFFAFYPVLIVLFGIGRPPIVAIGVLFAMVAMIIATLDAFDRIPRALIKTAHIYRMTAAERLLRIELPYAVPHVFTGIKLAVAYAFIGVIASEFIMSASGLGYRIAYAFNNFDNRTMYALMLLVIGLVTIVNAVFYTVEQRLLRRRSR